jgi:hypothetical protein
MPIPNSQSWLANEELVETYGMSLAVCRVIVTKSASLVINDA